MVQFALLGPLEVSAGGVALPIGGPRQRAVLARLLVDPQHVVSTDALLDAVWGEHPPATAVKTLQKYVVELRRVLGREILRTQGRGYLLQVDDAQIDSRQFERLLERAREAERHGDVARGLARRAEAERLWRGEVLADFPDATFAAPEKARLHELRLSSVETALELELARDRPDDATARAAELIEVYPMRERLWSAFIRALYRTGRQVDALRAYERYRRVLAEELGLEPSAELRALELAVLRQDPVLGTTQAEPDPAAAGNLPRPRSRLIGRTADLAAVETAVGEHRLVTVVGTAGVGKTRVAVAAATRIGERCPGGCWFVDLAAVAHPDHVVRAVAESLSVDDQPGENLLDSLVEALAARAPTLIVLDNCEHLLRACALTVDRLLSAAPPVMVLATSRQRLGVPEEHVVALGSLPAEPGDDGGPAPAVELFVERARDAAPGVDLSPDDLVAAAQVCARLDGIPLAIELAASQVRVLEPAEIAAHLDGRLRFVAASADSASRHRTLEAAVGWSYERLPETTRLLFDRLSVFAEYCTVEAAEAVAAPDLGRADVLAGLVDLVDGWLLVRERGPASVARFRMLETLRLFGRRRLEDAGLLEQAMRAHAGFFLALATAAGPHLFGPAELTWRHRLHLEEPNLRGALGWASRHDPGLATRLCVALWPYWSTSWKGEEGLGYLRPLLNEPDDRIAAHERAWALTAAAWLSSEMGEARRATAWAEEALAWFDRHPDELGHPRAQLALGAARGNAGEFERADAVLTGVLEAAQAGDDKVLHGLTLEAWGLVASRRGDQREATRRQLLGMQVWTELGSVGGQATSLLLQAHAARSTGDLDAARNLARQAQEAYTSSDNPVASAHALNVLADVARKQGDTAAAETTYHEARAVFRACGDRGCLASTQRNLAVIRLRCGDLDQAAALLREAMRLRNALDDRNGVAECLDGYAELALARHEPVTAATLLAAGTALRTSARPATELAARARDALDDAAFEQAWAEGARLGATEAVDYASRL